MTNFADKKVLIMGSFCNISGYSLHSRTLADSLINMENGPEVFLIDLQWAEATRSSAYISRYRERLTHTQQFMKFLQSTNAKVNEVFDCSFQVRPPNEWQRVTNFDVGVTAALETVAAPKEWVDNCNMMKKILVVSSHAKKNLLNAVCDGRKITTPIDVVPFYNTMPENKEKFSGYNDVTTSKNFLCVSQLAPRKNLHNMIAWFIEEFKDDPEAGLILKTYIKNNSVIDCQMSKDAFHNFISTNFPEKKCKIYLLHGGLSDSEIETLYDKETITGYISAAHGEGFGIPIFNAVCSGIPVIAPAWSGHLDFLNAPVKNETSGKVKTRNLFLKTSYEIEKVKEVHLMPGLITEDCKWCYPESKSFKKNLRSLFKSPRTHNMNAELLKEHIIKTHSKDKVESLYQDAVKEIILGKAEGKENDETLYL